MNDTIVQEVREARAALAEQFGYDRARIIAWAREQTKARKALLRNNKANKQVQPTGVPPLPDP